MVMKSATRISRAIGIYLSIIIVIKLPAFTGASQPSCFASPPRRSYSKDYRPFIRDYHHDPTTCSPSMTKTRRFASLEYLDDSNMDTLLFRPRLGRPRSVLVDACAAWCGPCKLIEPFLLNCAEKYSNKLSILKYDVEGSNIKNLKVELLLQGVMVRGLPTLILYHDGKPLAIHSGAISETQLETWLDDKLFSDITSESNQKGHANDENSMGGKIKSQNIDAHGSGEVKRGFVSIASQFGRDDYAL